MWILGDVKPWLGGWSLFALSDNGMAANLIFACVVLSRKLAETKARK